MTKTLTPEGAIKQAGLGWDGSAWHKLVMLWGYSDRYAESASNLSMPAGISNVNCTAVPAGEVWKVSGATIVVISATCSEFRPAFDAGGVTIPISNVLAPVSGQLYPFVFDATLKAGDFMLGRFYGMTLNDDAYVIVFGYKMKVAE